MEGLSGDMIGEQVNASQCTGLGRMQPGVGGRGQAFMSCTLPGGTHLSRAVGMEGYCALLGGSCVN